MKIMMKFFKGAQGGITIQGGGLPVTIFGDISIFI